MALSCHRWPVMGALYATAEPLIPTQRQRTLPTHVATATRDTARTAHWGRGPGLGHCCSVLGLHTRQEGGRACSPSCPTWHPFIQPTNTPLSTYCVPGIVLGPRIQQKTKPPNALHSTIYILTGEADNTQIYNVSEQ